MCLSSHLRPGAREAAASTNQRRRRARATRESPRDSCVTSSRPSGLQTGRSRRPTCSGSTTVKLRSNEMRRRRITTARDYACTHTRTHAHTHERTQTRTHGDCRFITPRVDSIPVLPLSPSHPALSRGQRAGSGQQLGSTDVGPARKAKTRTR